MASDQGQNLEDTNSTRQRNGKPSEGTDDQKETHRTTKAPEAEEKQSDTQKSRNIDNTHGTPDHDTEPVETEDDREDSEGTGIAGRKQKLQRESDKSDSATSIAGDEAEPIKMDDASKRSDEGPITPEAVTAPSSREAETPLEKDMAFVEEICSKVRAIDVLDNIINDPYNVELRKKFSKAVDRLILERQHHTGNTDNLLIPINKIASLVINHAKADEKSRLFRTRAEQESSQSLKDAYEKRIQEFERTKLALENEWKALLKAKHYPHAWSTKLEALNAKFKILWKTQEVSPTDLSQDLDKQKALACEVWEVSEIDDVERSEHLSWALESHNAKKHSRKRGLSQDQEPERPQKR